MTLSKRLKLMALTLVIGVGGLELGGQMLVPGFHGFVSPAKRWSADRLPRLALRALRGGTTGAIRAQQETPHLFLAVSPRMTLPEV